MQRPPAELTRHICEFSAQLRARQAISAPASVRNYREFLRANITGVIAGVFPLFSQQAGSARVEDLAAAFLAGHGAVEAEFHQIATEFVLFIHHRDDLTSDERQLIEYEWVLFCVEIDPSSVMASAVDPADRRSAAGMTLVLNPTLHCLRLPFALSAGQPVRCDPAETLIYAIFRNRRDEVLQKQLLSFDRTLLHLCLDCGLSTLDDLRRQLPAGDARHLDRWLVSHQELDLISLQAR